MSDSKIRREWTLEQLKEVFYAARTMENFSWEHKEEVCAFLAEATCVWTEQEKAYEHRSAKKALQRTLKLRKGDE